jgi:hypothetical protein
VDDSSYRRLRADAEIERARRSRHPRAAEAHSALARLHLESISDPPAEVRHVPRDSGPCGRAGHDEWAVRMANIIASERAGLATDYVLAKIEAGQALGHVKSVEAWKSVLMRLQNVPVSQRH